MKTVTLHPLVSLSLPSVRRALPRRIQKLLEVYREISIRLVNEHAALTPSEWLQLDTEREIIQEKLHKKYVWRSWQQ